MGHPPRDLPKGLLKVSTRGVHTKLEVAEDCEGCGKPMHHLVKGILEVGYVFDLSPCDHCRARHKVRIHEDGYELILVGEDVNNEAL